MGVQFTFNHSYKANELATKQADEQEEKTEESATKKKKKEAKVS